MSDQRIRKTAAAMARAARRTIGGYEFDGTYVRPPTFLELIDRLTDLSRALDEYELEIRQERLAQESGDKP